MYLLRVSLLVMLQRGRTISIRGHNLTSVNYAYSNEEKNYKETSKLLVAPSGISRKIKSHGECHCAIERVGIFQSPSWMKSDTGYHRVTSSREVYESIDYGTKLPDVASLS